MRPHIAQNTNFTREKFALTRVRKNAENVLKQKSSQSEEQLQPQKVSEGSYNAGTNLV